MLNEWMNDEHLAQGEMLMEVPRAQDGETVGHLIEFSSCFVSTLATRFPSWAPYMWPASLKHNRLDGKRIPGLKEENVGAVMVKILNTWKCLQLAESASEVLVQGYSAACLPTTIWPMYCRLDPQSISTPERWWSLQWVQSRGRRWLCLWRDVLRSWPLFSFCFLVAMGWVVSSTTGFHPNAHRLQRGGSDNHRWKSLKPFLWLKLIGYSTLS